MRHSLDSGQRGGASGGVAYGHGGGHGARGWNGGCSQEIEQPRAPKAIHRLGHQAAVGDIESLVREEIPPALVLGNGVGADGDHVGEMRSCDRVPVSDHILADNPAGLPHPDIGRGLRR